MVRDLGESSSVRRLKDACREALVNNHAFAEFPVRPPDMLNAWPIPVIYTTNTRWTWGTASRGASHGDAAARQGEVTVIVEIHVPSALPTLGEALARLEPFEDTVPSAFFVGWASGFLKDYALRFKELRGRIDDLGYGDDDTFGWRWEADFELEEDVPYG